MAQRIRVGSEVSPVSYGGKARWHRTQMAKQRLQEEGKLERIGGIEYYGGRRIIGRDAPIDGGVYIGGHGREAIVVDSKKCPGLRILYEKARALASENGKVRRHLVLRAVYNVVDKAFENKSEHLVSALLYGQQLQNDRKVSIDFFIAEKTGVCRHMNLACAALLEMFKRDGHIRGKASVDRNQMDAGAHVWCRYTSYEGKVMILDVMQGFFGTLQEADSGAMGWSYRRENE